MASSNSLLKCLFTFKNLKKQKLVKMVWQIGHEKMLCKNLPVPKKDTKIGKEWSWIQPSMRGETGERL